MKKILFASKNKGKIEELKQILDELDIYIISLSEINKAIEIEESGNTFEENALIKAKLVYDSVGIPTIADDSGLVVEQLNGAPGVYSARYAGEEGDAKKNNIKLLEELKRYSKPHNAKFVCVAVYYDGKNIYSEIGELKGEIIEEERGTNGFGYDPLFLPYGFAETLAELEPKVKNSISHRYNAFQNLKKHLI